VVRLVNQHFLKLWQQHDPEGRKNRGLLSLMRRHHWKLSAVQKERLHQYLAQSPTLQALYVAKQQLNGFLGMKSLKRKRARRMLPQFLALIAQFEQSPARALAATLKSWLEPIVRMWRFTKSNGITEGFHTKMEMISRLYIINGGHRHSLDLFLRRTCLKETMPMSPIDSILGNPGLVVQAVKRTKDIHVWAVPRQRPACV